MNFYFDDFDLGFDDIDCCGNCYRCPLAVWENNEIVWCSEEE